MTIHRLNPLEDPRWAALVESHPRASVFHTAGWLRALRDTYGYQPVAFTTSPADGPLTDAVVGCDVHSWLTGRRLVSLPFSDHCEPLVDDERHLGEICRGVNADNTPRDWEYLELRSRSGLIPDGAAEAGDRFWFHTLDLQAGLDTLFRRLHRDSFQRKIRRAEKSSLTCDEGRDATLLREFYQLLVQTRRRHNVPPQPFGWFSHLLESMGASITIRIARAGSRAVAGMVTLQHRDVLVFKYGASDETAHPMGGVPLLFWKAIQAGCVSGCTALDLGRTDLDNNGLVTFKDRLGAFRVLAQYARLPLRPATAGAWRGSVTAAARRVFDSAPSGLRAAAGRLLYRHVG